MSAIAAVDTALWDIKGKIAGLPLYQLLGGRSRSAVMVYGHATGRDIAETVDEVLRHQAEGYRAIRAQSGVPGLDKVYGVSGSGHMYEPADSHLPAEHDWDSAKYLRHTPRLFEAVRAATGEEVHLLHDVHHRLTPIEAAQLGRSLEPYRLFWIEDPTPAENQQAFRLIRQHTTTPIAVGEVFNSIWDCKWLIEEQLIDYIRATITHAGGITHLRRIADLADLYQVRTGCHGATDLSPVCMGAALHFDTWVPNFGVQEYMPHSELMLSVFQCDWRFEQGMLYCGEKPGHGVDIDEKLAARYPYQRAYLPVNRLQHDGSLHSW
jgi:mannonate dehydratase